MAGYITWYWNENRSQLIWIYVNLQRKSEEKGNKIRKASGQIFFIFCKKIEKFNRLYQSLLWRITT